MSTVGETLHPTSPVYDLGFMNFKLNDSRVLKNAGDSGESR